MLKQPYVYNPTLKFFNLLLQNKPNKKSVTFKSNLLSKTIPVTICIASYYHPLRGIWTIQFHPNATDIFYEGNNIIFGGNQYIFSEGNQYIFCEGNQYIFSEGNRGIEENQPTTHADKLSRWLGKDPGRTPAE